MGKPIVYCGSCGKSLREAEFEKGKAHVLDGAPYCVQCRPMEAGAPPRPSPAPAPAPKDKSLATSALPRVRTISTPGSAAVFVGVGLAALAAFILAAVLLSGGSSTPARLTERSREPEASSRSTPSPVSSAASLSPEEQLAKAALDKASAFAKTHPDDLEGQSRLWEEAILAARNTGLLERARQEANRVRTRIQDLFFRELQAVEDKIRDPLAHEEFARVIGELEAAQKRRPDPEWRGRIASRIRDIQDSGGRLLGPLQELAVQAERRGASADAKAIADRVGRWGLPDLERDLQAALAAARAAPREKPPTKEMEAYRERWTEAMALASARDYGAAIQRISADGSLPQDAELRDERTADLGFLRSAAALVRSALAALSRRPKDQPLTLEFWNEQGAPETASGLLLRTDPSRMALGKDGEFRFVEFGELTAACLVAAWNGQPEKDRKPDEAAGIPMLYLLEGDLEKAQAAGKPALPEKYGVYAKKRTPGRGILGETDREAEARRRFFSLERDFFVVSKTSEAVEGFKSLLKSASETPFIRRNRASLEERAEGGREFFFFAGDLGAAGGFELAKNEKVEACLTLARDLEAAQAKESYVEISFSVLPGVDYRCWIQAGACCAETFQFSAQVTDLKVPNPKKSGEQVALDPGSEFSIPVKNSIVGLKKTHALHGGPKQPARWEWIVLPLPKFSAPGPKTIRLFSEHKGFSVAAAWITSARPTLPREAEIREFRKFRRAPQPKAAAKASAAGKVIFSENFDNGMGRFGGGELADGGVNGSKACLTPPSGVGIWSGFSIPATSSGTLSFKVKPLADVDVFEVLVWSAAKQDNGHFVVENLKKGEWREIKVPLTEIRIGWGKDAPSIDVVENLKFFFRGPAEARVLVDDIEIRG